MLCQRIHTQTQARVNSWHQAQSAFVTNIVNVTHFKKIFIYFDLWNTVRWSAYSRKWGKSFSTIKSNTKKHQMYRWTQAHTNKAKTHTNAHIITIITWFLCDSGCHNHRKKIHYNKIKQDERNIYLTDHWIECRRNAFDLDVKNTGEENTLC